jgi:hypothetical protein
VPEKRINQLIVQMGGAMFENEYKGGETSNNYRSSLGIRICRQIYSGRRMVKAGREIIPFLWRAGRYWLDF